MYAIRRVVDGLFFARQTTLGGLWVGDPAIAKRFEFMTTATAFALFELHEPIESVAIVPVEAL
jgi:hypothetical protein